MTVGMRVRACKWEWQRLRSRGRRDGSGSRPPHCTMHSPRIEGRDRILLKYTSNCCYSIINRWGSPSSDYYYFPSSFSSTSGALVPAHFMCVLRFTQ